MGSDWCALALAADHLSILAAGLWTRLRLLVMSFSAPQEGDMTGVASERTTILANLRSFGFTRGSGESYNIAINTVGVPC